MGCGVSKEHLARYAALELEKNDLELRLARMNDDFRRLKDEMAAAEVKHGEQSNLLRFKIEVLVHMLAVEEKKLDAAVKRLDALKWAMLTQGISEQNMNAILSSVRTENKGLNLDKPQDINGAALSSIDLAGAITRLRKEFETSKESIILCFADNEGRISDAMKRDEFVRVLYSATEKLTRADVQVISLRFYDGTMVSVVEFLEFFCSTPSARSARAAATAVRLSLSVLQLHEGPQRVESSAAKRLAKAQSENLGSSSKSLKSIATHEMTRLELACSRLFSIWLYVDEALDITFKDINEELRGDGVMSLDMFKEVLRDICGQDGSYLPTAEQDNQLPAKSLVGIDSVDIDLISERFEVGGRVNFNQFLLYFREAANLESAVSMASPFRFSSDWSLLKKTASTPNLPPTPPTPAPAAPATPLVVAAPAPKRLITPPKPVATPAPIPAPRPITPPPVVVVADPKPEPAPAPTLAPAPVVVVEEKPAATPAPAKPTKPKPGAAPLDITPLRGFPFGLIETYKQDPEYFDEQLHNMSVADGYLYSAQSLSTAILNLVPHVKDDEVKYVLDHLVFKSNNVPQMEVVELFHAILAEYEGGPSLTSTAPVAVSTPVPLKKAAASSGSSGNVAAATTGSNGNTKTSVPTDDTAVRLARLAFYRELRTKAQSNTILRAYKADPAGFETHIKAAPANKKAFVGPELRSDISSLVPDATQEELDTMERELLPLPVSSASATSKTSAPPSATPAAVLTYVRRLDAYANEYDKRVKRAELAIERVAKVAEYAARTEVDAATRSYKESPRQFEAAVRGAAAAGHVPAAVYYDLITTAGKLPGGRVVDAETAVKHRTALYPNEATSTTGVPIAAVVAYHRGIASEVTRAEGLLAAEKRALSKEDADDKVRTASGGGFLAICGLGGGGVTTEVFDPNAPEDLALVAQAQSSAGNTATIGTTNVSSTSSSSGNSTPNTAVDPNANAAALTAILQQTAQSATFDTTSTPIASPGVGASQGGSSSKSRPQFSNADSLALSSDSDVDDSRSDVTPTNAGSNVRVINRRRDDAGNESKSESKFSGGNRPTAKPSDSSPAAAKADDVDDEVQEFDSP